MSKLSLLANLTSNIPSLTAGFTPSGIQVDLAADVFVANNQTVGTSAELLVVGDIGTAGYAAFINKDATNYVDLSLETDGSNPFAKLKPGELAILRVGTKVIYAKANTAQVTLGYVMFSD